MTRADFVNELAQRLDIQRKEMIEKDVILHELLLDLSKNEFFSSSFAFKGGTCLIKCYYGYKRFSEDIDFTWKNQADFQGKSQKQIRNNLSDTISRTGKLIEEIASKRGLEFKCKKSDMTFVELGGSNKLCTFKVWYDSEILNRRSFIKIQINFVEEMCFKSRRGRAQSLLVRRDPQLKALFPESNDYAATISLDVYDIREIMSEKVRALLTTRGTKVRDFIDVYPISKEYGLAPEAVEGGIIRKTKFAVGLYSRFGSNRKAKEALLRSGKIFAWGQERGLLLSGFDEAGFHSFLGGFEKFLVRVIGGVLA